MRTLTYAFILFAISLMFAALARAQEAPAVLISEIMYDLAGSDDKREWVEIVNSGSAAVTVVDGSGEGSWRVHDGSSHTFTLVQGNGTLSPGEFGIIASDGPTFQAEHPSYQGNLWRSAISLGNSGDALKLSADAGQTWFSEVSYASSQGGAGNGKALERKRSGGVWSGDWQEGAADGGTPGSAPAETGGDGQGDPPPANQPPVAIASAQPASATVGQTIQFSAAGSSDPEGQPLTYQWQFGDGQSGSGLTAAHAYQQPGSYTAQLTVSDSQSGATATVVVNVSAPVQVDQPTVVLPSSSQSIVGNAAAARLLLNELLPDPVGDDRSGEFIELLNAGSGAIGLGGWSLRDEDGRTYPLPAQTVPSGGLISVPRSASQFTLDNGGGAVELRSSDGAAIDRVQYAAAKSGRAWARQPGGSWEWVEQPTPGAANASPSAAAPPTGSVNAVSDPGAAAAPAVASGNGDLEKSSNVARTVESDQSSVSGWPQFDQVKRNSAVELAAVVLVEPGVLGAGQAVLVDPDGDGGPVLALLPRSLRVKTGQRLSISAKVRQRQGRPALEVVEAQIVSGKLAPVAPEPKLTGEIDEGDVYALVSVSGTVSDRRGRSFNLDDGSGSLRITLPNVKGDWPKVANDQEVAVSGVLKPVRDELVLVPRKPEDVTVGAVESESAISGNVNIAGEPLVLGGQDRQAGAERTRTGVRAATAALGTALVGWFLKIKEIL